VFLPRIIEVILVILKLFAIHNNPSRKFKELGDIRDVFQHVGMNIGAMQKHFAKYGIEKYYDEITKDLESKK